MASDKTAKKETKRVQPSINAFTHTKVASKEIRQQCLTATTMAIISMGVPKRTVLNKHFRIMQQKFAKFGARAPKKGFGVDAVNSEIKALVTTLKASVMERLRGQVIHGTTDHWTSRDNRSFESLCFHWIENFKLVSLSAECKEYIGSTTSQKLVENYVSRLSEWGITGKPDEENQYVGGDKTVLANLTKGMASNMNLMGILLESQFFITSIYCSDHVIQGTAVLAYRSSIVGDDETETDSDGLLCLGKGTVAKCRKLVQFFTTSSQRQQDLEQAQRDLGKREQDPVIVYRDANQPYKVVQDVVVRWWSTYAMIQRLIILKPALERLNAENKLKNSTDRANSPSRMLTENEWRTLESLAGLLKPWKEAQQVLESEKIVTSSLVLPHLKIIHGKLKAYIDKPALSIDDDEQDPKLSASLVELAKNMMADFKSRWDNLSIPFRKKVQRGHQRRQVGIHPNFMLAHALDPRFKNLTFVDNKDNKEELWGAILEEMVIARQQQQQQQQLALESTPNSSSDVSGNSGTAGICARATTKKSNKRLKTSASSEWDMYIREEEEDGFEGASLVSYSTILADCQDELLKYKKSRGIPIFVNEDRVEMNDPLAWWKSHHMSFPTVWLLARYFLGIPATSASSERSFSVAGRILNPLAAGSTRSDNFEDMHFLRQSMKEFMDED
jgi:hypothetical protein